jgi:hypothetical protein
MQAEEPPHSESSGGRDDDIAGGVPMPFHMQMQRQQENTRVNEEGIEEIEMEPSPPSKGGYSRAFEESRDGSSGGGAAKGELPLWLRD